jgi:hypothetical protein
MQGNDSPRLSNVSRIDREDQLRGARPANQGNLRRAIIAEADDNDLPAGDRRENTSRVIYLQMSTLRVKRAVRAVFCHLPNETKK